MTIAVVKLVLTPILIAAATLAGRRWGPGVSGWLAGLPLTSGPVSVFLAIEQGPAFAAQAARGTLLGVLSMAAFCVVYGRLARHAAWPACTAAGLLTFAVSTLLLGHARIPLVPAFGLVCALLAVMAVAMPATASLARTASAPAWDLPLRMAVATGIVLLITGAAPLLGPTLSGLLSPLPVFALILAVFAHRAQGPGAAARLLRGVVVGTYSFAVFLLVVGLALPRAGLGATYLLATAGALAVNGGVLYLGRRIL